MMITPKRENSEFLQDPVQQTNSGRPGTALDAINGRHISGDGPSPGSAKSCWRENWGWNEFS
jgi:hypothetical protein